MDELLIDYDQGTYEAVFQTAPELSSGAWFVQLRRVLHDQTPDVTEPAAGQMRTPWWAFVGVREGIGALLKAANVKYAVTEAALVYLRLSAARKQSYRTSSAAAVVLPELVLSRLHEIAWQRELTPEQLRNVGRLIGLPAGATFSVPGAGKTTEALAYYFMRAVDNQPLVVVAPKNAFSAWDEQMLDCMGPGVGQFVRLRGGWDAISEMLETRPRFMLITYQQFARVAGLIAQDLSRRASFVFLDESHKIKSGRTRVTPDAILKVAHLPTGKLLLSGTPMPQSPEDLVPQFEFLYPEIPATAEDVISLIRPIFVRTTKDELRLPPVNRKLIAVPFNPAQKRLYELMRSEVARQAERTLNQGGRTLLRSLGRSVMRLLEVVSNPSLLANDITFLHDELLGEVLAEGAAPKVRFACERGRRLAKRGLKTIIWSTFRQNVESIAEQLRDLNAVYIHGGIDAGSEDDEGTREGRIRRFKTDQKCFIMVGNPAAAGEGISLHKVCRHAIYVDRTYNAAHYIQSEDRIHRLGLGPDESPTVEILICPNSIDESVQSRIETKVAAMAAALEDRSLSVRAEQYVPFDADDEPENESEVLDMDDVRSILEWLRREP